MGRCSVCGKELPDASLRECDQCNRVYCKECAEKDSSMSALGICSDCEETFQADEELDEE